MTLPHEAGAGGAGGAGGGGGPAGLPGHTCGGPAGPSAHSIVPVSVQLLAHSCSKDDPQGLQL